MTKKRKADGTQQKTLLKHGDVELEPKHCAGQRMLVNKDWVSSGLWVIGKHRIKNVHIFDCLQCLRRETKALSQGDFDIDLKAFYPDVPIVYRLEPITERVHSVEHYIFVSDFGKALFVARATVDNFGITELYGGEPGELMFDAKEWEDVSLACASVDTSGTRLGELGAEALAQNVRPDGSIHTPLPSDIDEAIHGVKPPLEVVDGGDADSLAPSKTAKTRPSKKPKP